MVHGDDKGLVLPPNVAGYQASSRLPEIEGSEQGEAHHKRKGRVRRLTPRPSGLWEERQQESRSLAPLWLSRATDLRSVLRTCSAEVWRLLCQPLSHLRTNCYWRVLLVLCFEDKTFRSSLAGGFDNRCYCKADGTTPRFISEAEAPSCQRWHCSSGRIRFPSKPRAIFDFASCFMGLLAPDRRAHRTGVRRVEGCTYQAEEREREREREREPVTTHPQMSKVD